MMSLRKLVVALLVFVLGGSACGSPRPATTQQPGADPGFNLLILAEGKVELKRNEWSDFHATSFGAVLHRGDQLRLSAGASAAVLCDNLKPWFVPAGAPSGLSNGCPQTPKPALVRTKGLIANTRGGTDPLIPYIISPRGTRLLSPTPTLRWNPVPGAKSYTVRISGVDWQDMLSTTEVVYPRTPPLKAGVTYLLTVEADNGRSSQEEGTPGLGFSLLPDEEAMRVGKDVLAIDGLNLSEGAKAFALAQLYAGHGIYAEAIERLEGLSGADSQEANVYHALGVLYQQVGLLALSESRHTRALGLAEKAGDVESTAAAQASLGEVYAALGNKSEAIRYLTLAQVGYKDLGDSQRAGQIVEQLAELGK